MNLPEAVFKVVRRAVPLFSEEVGVPFGGYLCVTEGDLPVLVVRIGEIPPRQMRYHFENCQATHLPSTMKCKDGNGLCFSGIDPVLDYAITLVVGVTYSLIPEASARELAIARENPHFEELLELCRPKAPVGA
jgi:hypothetical protein